METLQITILVTLAINHSLHYKSVGLQTPVLFDRLQSVTNITDSAALIIPHLASLPSWAVTSHTGPRHRSHLGAESFRADGKKGRLYRLVL